MDLLWATASTALLLVILASASSQAEALGIFGQASSPFVLQTDSALVGGDSIYWVRS